ncbi:MAG: type III-A CRISPR-associated RAMP protein Csm5 [Chloroherpetonaceae bacterium]|nr:type III-A CRISPR-associated RAMP protein Csm5 [Chloroherpetonaceae bacterium]
MSGPGLITYHLTLTTLSPVHIGTGRENVLSPVSDYIIEKVSRQPVCIFIDVEKLQETISSDKIYAEEYVKEVGKVLNGKTQFDLRAFIQRTLKKKVETFQTRCLPIYGKLDAKIQLHPHITSAGKAYIPGSSIKGAVRTALLYQYFTHTEEGKKQVEELIGHLNQYAQNQLKRRELERSKELSEKEKREQRRKLDKERSELEEKIDQALDEQNLFGRLSRDTSNDARFLRFSDTEAIEDRFLAIREVERKNIRNFKKREIPQFCEVIERGSITSFTISVEPRLQHQSLSFLNQPDFEALAKCINGFSQDCIEVELSELESSPNKSELLGVIAFYQSLRSQIQNAFEKRMPLAILRIGRHKTYFDNSLGLVLFKQSREAFEILRMIKGIGRNPRTKKITEGQFPITRSFANNLAMGWISISTDADLATKIASYIFSEKLSAIPSGISAQPTQPPNTVRAVIVDDQSKPPKVKILEGEYAEKEVQMPGVNLAGLELKNGSEVFVKLELSRDKKRLEKATYKAKAK